MRCASIAEGEVGMMIASAALSAASMIAGFPGGQSIMEKLVVSCRALMERAFTACTVKGSAWPFSSAMSAQSVADPCGSASRTVTP